MRPAVPDPQRVSHDVEQSTDGHESLRKGSGKHCGTFDVRCLDSRRLPTALSVDANPAPTPEGKANIAPLSHPFLPEYLPRTTRARRVTNSRRHDSSPTFLSQR